MERVLKKLKKLERDIKTSKRRHKSRCRSPLQRRSPRRHRARSRCRSRSVHSPKHSERASSRTQRSPTLELRSCSFDNISDRNTPSPRSSRTPEPGDNKSEPPHSLVSDPAEVLDLDTELSDLDAIALKVLGADPSQPAVEPEIMHPQVKSRWAHIIKNGLDKENKEHLLAAYRPSSVLIAPGINAEIQATMPASTIQKDGYQKADQNLLGVGLTALAKCLDIVLHKTFQAPDQQKEELLTSLHDAGRLLTELFYRFSSNRRAIILPTLSTLSKAVKDAVTAQKPTTLLFGDELGKRVRAAKTIESTGKTLKANKPTYKLQQPTTPAKTQPNVNRLNRPGPSRQREQTRSWGQAPTTNKSNQNFRRSSRRY